MCFSCLHLRFLQTPPGLYKLFQFMLGSMCQTMLVNFGTGQFSLLGMAYVYLMTTASASVSTVGLLLVCYILSENSFKLVRSSLFETIFNASAAISYLSSSAYLALVVNVYLYPVYLVTLGFVSYPAMMAAYMMGFTLAAVHGIDAYQNYKHFKGIRFN